MNLYIPSCDFCDLEHLTTFKLAGLCKNYVQLHLLCNLKCGWSKSLCRFDHCRFLFFIKDSCYIFLYFLEGVLQLFFLLTAFFISLSWQVCTVCPLYPACHACAALFASTFRENFLWFYYGGERQNHRKR